MEKSMEKVVALAKNRGFVYAGSEIYGPGPEGVVPGRIPGPWP